LAPLSYFRNRSNVGAKTDRIDRLIEQAWRANAVASQGGNEGQRLAVTMRHLGDQALADGASSADRRHGDLRPGFINENKAPWINRVLPLLPLQASAGDVRAFGWICSIAQTSLCLAWIRRSNR
jgi:hypothetical protein